MAGIAELIAIVRKEIARQAGGGVWDVDAVSRAAEWTAREQEAATGEPFDLLPWAADRVVQGERRRKAPSGQRLYQTVRTADGLRLAKRLPQMTLFEGWSDIKLRQAGIDADRADLRRLVAVYREARRVADERGLDHRTTHYCDVLDEQEIERIWTAA